MCTNCNFHNLPDLETICVDDTNNTNLIDYILGEVGHEVTFTDNCYASINELNNSDLVRVYPNPTGNTLYISSDLKIKNIDFYNQTGQLVLSSNKENDYDISELN